MNNQKSMRETIIKNALLMNYLNQKTDLNGIFESNCLFLHFLLSIFFIKLLFFIGIIIFVIIDN